jgi:hypothetical protein
MNNRPTLSFPTPKAPWTPHRGRPIRTPVDLLVTVAVIAVMAAALFFL